MELQNEAEQQRVAKLKEYNILDTNTDLKLDEITKLAALICDAPIALISLVDSDRQWFKSRVGLEVCQTPREISFCTHAIAQDELFIIEDAHLDQRFEHNILVTGEPFVRFYAGHPLKTPCGYNIGTLCVIDHVPRTLNEKQKLMFQVLSAQIVNYLELYKAKEELQFMQTNIIKKETISSVMSLSSGIAHEINNPLAIIVGKINTISNRIENYERNNSVILNLQKDFEVVSNASFRIAKIIKSLKKFTQTDENENFYTANLYEIINSIIFVFERKFKNENITVELDIDAQIKINCMLVNLSHAFYNLILNSYESIRGKDSPWIRISAQVCDKNKITLSFVDSGEGIDSAIVNRLMEPFISTKEFMNSPKGLGLCIAKGIIESHEGQIIYNISGKNTEFKVFLNALS